MDLKYSERAADVIRYVWSGASVVAWTDAVFEYAKGSDLFLPLVALSIGSVIVAYKFGKKS